MAAEIFCPLLSRREWVRLLGERRQRLCRIAYIWSKNPDLAEDLVQETMIRALRCRKQLRDPKCLDAWLFRILYHCLQDHLRFLSKTKQADEFQEPETQHPEVILGRSEEIAQVRDAVASLPDGQRQVLTLVDLEGLSYAEVSQVLDIPIGTVMSRLCRARGRLRERLKNFYGEPLPDKKGTHLRRIK